jgi:uncharacterized protein with PIN domain
MIVVDSSALIAILFDEPEKQSFETNRRAVVSKRDAGVRLSCGLVLA